jgi:hypothetical protein
MTGLRALVSAPLALVSLPLAVQLAAPAAAAPNVERHSLKWFVHDSLGGLASYEPIIDATIEEAAVLLKGYQGPADVPCCAELEKASIQEFSDITGQDLSVLNTPSDYYDLETICANAGGGMCAFLVQSITWCGDSANGVIAGCADRPSCDSSPTTMFLALSLDTDDPDHLGRTLAHERGHNACLEHVSANACQLMSSSGGGGCLSQAECQSYLDASTSTLGSACGCHNDAFGTIGDGSSCSEVSDGVCSGGVCGETGSDASVSLLAAGGPEALEGGSPDDPLAVSGASGGWTDLGSFDGSSTEVTGLAYSPGRSTLYGVTADAALVTLNPDTGAIASTLGTLPTSGLYSALAFNPGATEGLEDDVLYAIRTDEGCSLSGFCTDSLIEIDPDDASATTLFQLSIMFQGGIQGLAYDSQNGRLVGTAYVSSMLWEIDPGCQVFACRGATELTPSLDTRITSSLAYSPDTGRFYVVGSQSGPRTLFDSVDATSFAPQPTIGIDGYTPGGLAALPEPAAAPAQALAIATLLWLARHRRYARSSRPVR